MGTTDVCNYHKCTMLLCPSYLFLLGISQYWSSDCLALVVLDAEDEMKRQCLESLEFSPG